MTLLELRYLVALAQTHHFGRAAELCGVSQSNLSMAIRKLEESLGVLLFERSKNGICATDMGVQIIAQAQRVIAQTDTITALADADKNQLSGSLTIGSIFTLGPYLLPPLIPQLKLFANNLQLMLYEGYLADLQQKLRYAELDAILVSQAFSEPDIVTQKVYTEVMQVVMPPNHPLAAKKMISVQDLRDQPFLLLNAKQCLREQMLAAFTPNDDKMIECSSLETLRHMIALGVGVSILPVSATHSPLYSQQALATRPLVTNPQRNIFLAWRASFPRHKAIDVLKRAIQMSVWQFTTAADDQSSGLLVENNNW